MTSMRSCRMNCPVKPNIHPSIHTIIETTLSKDIQEKLDRINCDSLKDKYGISRETFYNNPHLAKIQGGDFRPTEWFGERTESVFNSVSLDSIKESIGRYCLDEGIGFFSVNYYSSSSP